MMMIIKKEIIGFAFGAYVFLWYEYRNKALGTFLDAKRELSITKMIN